MSRYHRVRPKKHKRQAPAVSQPAVPQPAAQPADADLEELAAKFYGYLGGELVDASIARWKKLLAVHDREVAQFAGQAVEGGYRWTVSPAIAFRIDKYLHSLFEQRAQLLSESYAEAREWLARKGEGDSLCLAKDASDAAATPSAGAAAPAPSTPLVAEGGPAVAGPIAA